MTTPSEEREIVLVSACLVGIPSRYDGKEKKYEACLKHLADKIWVPVCPEQLGGLATPRLPAEIRNGDGFAVLRGEQPVLCQDGKDVTENFIRGAKIVADLAKALEIKKVYLKAKSPSCAVSGKCGVTAALLQERGLLLHEF